MMLPAILIFLYFNSRVNNILFFYRFQDVILLIDLHWKHFESQVFRSTTKCIRVYPLCEEYLPVGTLSEDLDELVVATTVDNI